MEQKYNYKNKLLKSNDIELKMALNKLNGRSNFEKIKFSSQYSFPLIDDNSEQNYSERFNFLQINKSQFQKNRNNKNKDELISELFKEIKILWNDLGIKKEYQEEFISFILNNENSEKRNKYITFEKNSLMKLKKNLMNYMSEKENRTKNIKLLKQLNNDIYISFIRENKINSSLIIQIIECIKNIRISSINLVKNHLKIRENLFVFFTKDKINFDVLYKNFLFDDNYLLRMNFELQFLNGSQINKIFILNNKENFDTFLTNYSRVKNNEEKLINNLSQEILNVIEKCRYYIYKEEIINKLNSANNIHSNSYKKICLLSKKTYMKNKYNEKPKTPKNHLDKKIQLIKTNLGRNYGKIFQHSFKKIKIPKNFWKKNAHYTFEPKKKFISIERESIKYDKTYFMKNYFKNKNDDINTKNEEKSIDLTKLNIDHSEIINIFSNRYNLDNTNDNNEKKENGNTNDNNNIISNNIEENNNNQLNKNSNINIIIENDSKEKKGNNEENLYKDNENINYKDEKKEEIHESNKNND